MCLPCAQPTEGGSPAEGEIPGRDDPQTGGGEEGDPQSPHVYRDEGQPVGDTQPQGHHRAQHPL